MPKVVDHDQRRVELVNATWRIIARQGIEGATMREIAAEAGFANGALKPYFPTKDDLLTFAFGHVFSQTSRRMRDATAGKAGLAALRAYCLEILPLDDIRLSEARIVIPFWQKALTDPQKAAEHENSMLQWRATMREQLGEARELGELRGSVPDDEVTGLLMNFVLGAQITAVLSPAENSPDQLVAQLDGYLGLFTADLFSTSVEKRRDKPGALG
ncbi:TetR/AcrR family transcriptional regulator [Cryobacterium sp. TMT1-21]|uniref:TetR/AcrR family transcriptional regulator n=1 Tax=Cryobacterium shii TaxID=1259235 RepID=A0AAQ2C4G6_9MICO|nr:MULTISPECIES: TetR/AcrR family transcriptional regulator [Cryobacterium]TFC42783.1 TetR/AcrR family transcriptional regulator [Cryobacterium shii]TFC89014.1 TetR/AcrR family transcriptional regulator [Cryobacterium sp. TmT2-59]TFD11582.1 TetR/AcrR family transcriptional regulator [Cryobacterium sp. TMT4-10]TFD14718.1 TetR/AcrR family transcriptional regulator [Cryobacterium sp. TMT1-21]TFD22305.1 TetR/AcrR family transcriptional regulator [Cryobacterium sp. TMT2-23]